MEDQPRRSGRKGLITGKISVKSQQGTLEALPDAAMAEAKGIFMSRTPPERSDHAGTIMVMQDGHGFHNP